MTTIDPQLKPSEPEPNGEHRRIGTSRYATLGDPELIARLRTGEGDVAGELFVRHHQAAAAVARQFVHNDTDADDIVSDSFTRVFNAIRNGSGPTENFRAYLYTAVRSSAYRRHATTKRLVSNGPSENLVDIESTVDPVMATFDRTAAGRAYASLPERWQSVLWMVEVEERPASEVAAVLGMTPNAVAALTYRAREGLRQAFLAAHGRETKCPECRVVRPMLSAFVRDKTSDRDTKRVVEHLKYCSDCIELVAELRDVNDTIVHGIAALLIPVAAVAALRAVPVLGTASTGTATGAAVAGTSGTTLLGTSGGAAAGGSASGTAAAGKAGLSFLKFAPRLLPSPFPAVVAGGTAAVASVAAAVLLSLGGDTSVIEQTASTDVPAVQSTTTIAGTTGSVEAPLPAPIPGVTPEPTVAAGSGPVTAELVPEAPAAPTTQPAPTSVPASVPPSTVVPETTPTTAAAMPPAGLHLTQLGPISGDGRGRVLVELSDLPGERGPAVLTWNAPAGVTIDPSSSNGADCDAERCIIDNSGPLGALDMTLGVRVTGAAQGRVLAMSLDHANGAAMPSSASLELGTPGGSFTTLFADVGNLAITGTGNSVVTCEPSQSGCLDARERVGELLANDYYELIPVTAGDPAGPTRSSAQLDLPAGATIRHAELLWSGQLATRGNEHPSARTVKIDLGNGLQQITADRTHASDNSGYQSSANITAMLNSSAARSGGTVTVEDVAVDVAKRAWGGWALAVVIEAPDLPRRAAVLTAGLVAGDSAVQIHSGRTARVTELLAVHWEGDANLLGDGLEIRGGAAAPTIVTDSANPPGDLANSNISILERRPGGAAANTFGVDVDLVAVDDRWRDSIEVGATAGPQEFRLLGLVGATFELR